MLRFFSILVLIFSVSIVSTRAQQPPSSKIVFSAGKNAVTADEFIYLYKKNHQEKPEEYTKEKIEEYFNLFVNFKLKVAEARARGLDTTAAFRKEFNSYRDEVRKPYLPDTKIVDSLVSVTYERMKEEVNASHILVNVPQDASAADEDLAYRKIQEIRNRAVKGEDFGSLAQNLSEDPSARVNKGNLGYFSAMQMVFPFENAAYETKVGEISQPLRTRFGFHILKVTDRRPSRGEVEVSHILVRTGEEKDNAKSKDLIFDIYDQLQKGESWNELCKEHSEDPGTKEHGGRLRPFGVGAMPSLPEFERMAFELTTPGEISDPFQSQYGWHIIRLERKIPLQSFDELQPTLKSRVARDERVQISKQALYQKLRTTHQFKENAEVKAKLVSSADSSLTKGKWNPSYQNANSDVLLQFGSTSFTVKQFIDHTKNGLRKSALSPSKYMEQLITNFADAKLLEIVEADISAKSPEYRWLLNEYYEGILLFDIMEKEVWNKASLDSIGQVKYYQDNASKYRAGERLDVTIYSSTTKDHIDKLQAVLADTAESSRVLTEFKIKKDNGVFEKDDRIALSKIPWTVGVHRAQNNNLYYLVDAHKIVPPGQKRFDEARADVISDYQEYLEKQWLTALRKKHPVRVNKKGKEFVVQQLSKK